jgi:hypothetical protein
MERCIDCNYLLTKEERVCIECGAKVGEDNSGVMDFVAPVVSILFYLSFAAMVASPFLASAPSFMVFLLTTCALLFVMRTTKDGARKLTKR